MILIFKSLRPNPRGTSRTIFTFKILMYLKSLLKGSSLLLNFFSVTSYSAERYYLPDPSFILLVYVVCYERRNVNEKSDRCGILCGLLRPFFVNFVYVVVGFMNGYF